MLNRIHDDIASDIVKLEQEAQQLRVDGICYVRQCVKEEFAAALQAVESEVELLCSQETMLKQRISDSQQGYETLLLEQFGNCDASSQLQKITDDQGTSTRLDIEAALRQLPVDEVYKYSQEIANILEAIGRH